MVILLCDLKNHVGFKGIELFYNQKSFRHYQSRQLNKPGLWPDFVNHL
jgi:hypothetical protein